MKFIADWKVKENSLLNTNYCLLKLTIEGIFPEILPGQFVQIKVDNSENTFLRRPISIHYADKKKHELWLLIQIVGSGTHKLSEIKPGETINLIYPLGKGFSIPSTANKNKKLLLIGGGVGIAPLLYLGACLKEKGFAPVFLFGARSEKDLFQLNEFEKIGTVHITTENGILGEKGFVTDHSILHAGNADFIYACGPKPMMITIARYAWKFNIPCEVSLENLMVCGIGACLCCVEKTVEGHCCVCTEGPVFNINQLIWQI
jgi:dihydroorotate dehydrogenase electron transfer subunit